MFPTTSGVLFFGAEGAKPVAWNAINAIPDFVMTDEDVSDEQSRIFATMRDSTAITMNCRISKSNVNNLIGLCIKGFKPARGPERKRMIKRAKKMQTNYISAYTFIKEGDEYVDERGQVRFILQ